MNALKLYENSLLPENKQIADEYLKARGIAKNTDVGFCYYNKIPSICFPVRNTKDKLVLLEFRSYEGKIHNKLPRKDYKGYFLYNIENAVKNQKYVVVTEGLMDCLSLTQFGINAISTLGANAPEGVYHLLTCWGRIYLALDNDEAGLNQTKNLLAFYSKFYSTQDVVTFDYYNKDINEALMNGNIESILNQIER